MQPLEIARIVNGKPRSAVMTAIGTVPVPDVIVGELLDFIQYENGEVNGFVGLALGTDACNKGTVNVDWFALPSNDHPFIPQNLYRMSGALTTLSDSNNSANPGVSTRLQRHRPTHVALATTA